MNHGKDDHPMLAIDDDYGDPPPDWEPSKEEMSLLADAPALDLDAHLGGEREAAEGRRWLEEREQLRKYEGPLTPTEKALEQERTKVKRLELRLLEARCRAFLFELASCTHDQHRDDAWVQRWEKRSDRVIAILEATRKELANVDR